MVWSRQQRHAGRGGIDQLQAHRAGSPAPRKQAFTGCRHACSMRDVPVVLLCPEHADARANKRRLDICAALESPGPAWRGVRPPQACVAQHAAGTDPTSGCVSATRARVCLGAGARSQVPDGARAGQGVASGGGARAVIRTSGLVPPPLL